MLEVLSMLRNPIQNDIGAQGTSTSDALEKLAKISHELSEQDYQARIADLVARELRYETALEKISQGVCFFDGEQRLILCNRRYAEIYRLNPEDVSPGTSLSVITQLRAAVGTVPLAVGDYLANLFVDNRLIAELKAAKTIADEHIAQMLGYLKASRIEHGLLINFGSYRFQIRKFVFSHGHATEEEEDKLPVIKLTEAGDEVE